jgi:hypothetical protein
MEAVADQVIETKEEIIELTPSDLALVGGGVGAVGELL